jgi:hypothetical protein
VLASQGEHASSYKRVASRPDQTPAEATQKPTGAQGAEQGACELRYEEPARLFAG